MATVYFIEKAAKRSDVWTRVLNIPGCNCGMCS